MAGKRKNYKKINGEVIFIDESGDPGLSKISREQSPYYTVGFVYFRRLAPLRKSLKRLLKKEHNKKRYPAKLNELKFYIPDSNLINKHRYTPEQLEKYKNFLPDIREKAIKIICDEATGVFGAILDKNSIKKPTWTSETITNYVFVNTLIDNVMSNISPQYRPSILYDDGRLSSAKTVKFEKYVANKDRYLGQNGLKNYKYVLPIPEKVASYSEPGIWAADIVAGAFQCKYHHEEAHYADLLKEKYIDNGKRLYWHI